MKFGEQLRSSIIPEYQWYYIDYDELKSDLKHATGPPLPSSATGREWTEEDETRFVGKLEAELEKVHTKQQVKAMEISRRIAVSEREVKEVVNRLNERGLNEQGPSEEEFMLLEEDLGDIIADVHDLAKFVQLNYTGFYKIIKKHDKMTGWHLRPAFETRLKAKPFYKENYDASVVKLSKLYDLVRTRGNPAKGDSAAGGGQANFIRQTTKYWVHPDNVTELKLIILKHLPVLVFNANKEFEPEDSAITSIYYDNPETFDLYEGRLKKTEGAEAIRLRWYGGMENETIFVERKTHREDWTGEKSVKARFSMKEKNVNAYLRGELLPPALFEKARKEGKKSEKAIAEDERLAAEIQYSVLKHGYKPVCRSFYHRTAFQLPADARVRISLDTELTMVREDNIGRRRSGDNWRRTDIGIDWPFPQLPPEDVVHFPYAVLEVKLQTQAGQEPPEWVRQLIASHLVEAVPKFSKFIHGTACLFPDRIHLLPYWMPQMDIDIRKPQSHDFGIRRPGLSGTTTTSDDDEEDLDSDDETRPVPAPPPAREAGQNGEGSGVGRGGRGDAERQTVDLPAVNEAFPIYDSDDEYDENYEMEEARRLGGWHYYKTLLATKGHALGRGVVSVLKHVVPRPRSTQVGRSARQEMLFGSEPIHTKKFRAPKGKKIYVPVRVEPKVYFAAERTFLGWLEYSTYIGTIAVTLLNFGQHPTRASFWVAGVFTLLAIASLIYSVFIYLYRGRWIRNRKAAKYYDKWGPSVLCGEPAGSVPSVSGSSVPSTMPLIPASPSHLRLPLPLPPTIRTSESMVVLTTQSDFGQAPPPQTPYSIVTNLSRWDDSRRLRDGDASIVARLTHIYPRFGPTQHVAQLGKEIVKRLGVKGKAAFVYLNPDMWAYTTRHATARAHRKEHTLQPADLTFKCVQIADHLLYLVLFDPQHASAVKESWGNVGLGLSVRAAEQLLEGIDNLVEVPVPDANSPPPPTWTPEIDAHGALRDRIASLVNRAPRRAAAAVECAPSDVFLYPTGMGAVHHSVHTVIRHRPGTVVVLGVVFHNSHHHLLEESPHGFKHVGRVDPEAMDEFEDWLVAQAVEGKPVSYVLVEFPGNPTLDTPDLARLKRLSEKHGFVLVVDDTIASFANTDLLPSCDILLTSLTKSFSGLADVMGGSIVLSPSSPHHGPLSTLFASSHRNELFAPDARVLLSNSQAFLSRAATLNRNAAAAAAFLAERIASDPDNCPLVKVSHPSILPTRPLYDTFMRVPTPDFPDPGYGCLLTLDFESVDAARAFHDNAGFYSSPHLGAHVTIQLPYNMVVWGKVPEDRVHMRQFGVKEEAIRLSVGLEPVEDIIDTLRHALDRTIVLKKNCYKE